MGTEGYQLSSEPCAATPTYVEYLLFLSLTLKN